MFILYTILASYPNKTCVTFIMAFLTINEIFKKIEVNPIFWRRSYRINQACLQEQYKCVKLNRQKKIKLTYMWG